MTSMHIESNPSCAAGEPASAAASGSRPPAQGSNSFHNALHQAQSQSDAEQTPGSAGNAPAQQGGDDHSKPKNTAPAAASADGTTGLQPTDSPPAKADLHDRQDPTAAALAAVVAGTNPPAPMVEANQPKTPAPVQSADTPIAAGEDGSSQGEPHWSAAAAAEAAAGASQASPATAGKPGAKTRNLAQPDQAAASNATALPTAVVQAAEDPQQAASDSTVARGGKSSGDNVQRPMAVGTSSGEAAANARATGVSEARTDDAAPAASDGNFNVAAQTAAVVQAAPPVVAPSQGTNADKDKQDREMPAVSAATTPAASAAAGQQPRAGSGATTAAGTADTAADAGAAPAAQTRFVQRVARAFEAMGDRTGSVRLRLSPPELGSLKLDISVKNGAMTAHVEADTAAAREMLLQNLPVLRDRLSQQNIKIESFNVDLADGGGGGTPGQTAQQNQSQPQTNLDPPVVRASQSKVSQSAATAPASRSVAGGNRLNVVV